MNDKSHLLHSSTTALVGSESATHLIEQKERIRQALDKGDVALVLDTSKAFLESVFKTVLTDRKGAVDDVDFSPLFKAVRQAMPISDTPDVAENLTKVTNAIVHSIGELRNRYGAASHGNDGYYESPVNLREAEMMVQFADGLAAFIYRRHKESSDPELAARLHYNDYPSFNDFLDTQYEGYNLGLSDKHSLSLSASEILFRIEPIAYRELLIQYRSTEAEET